MQRDARRRTGVRLQISFSAAASTPLCVLPAGPAAAAPVKRSIMRVRLGVLISEGARHIPRAGEGPARVSPVCGWVPGPGSVVGAGGGWVALVGAAELGTHSSVLLR